MSPLEPFGETVVENTEIDVRLHARCEEHGLVYKTWSWNCGEQAQQLYSPFTDRLNAPTTSPPKVAADSSNHIQDAVVPFDIFDPDDEDASCHATLSAFMWLRRDGFPAAEQGIRHHEWLRDVPDQEDEEAYESWLDCEVADGAKKRKAKSDIFLPKLTRWRTGIDRTSDSFE